MESPTGAEKLTVSHPLTSEEILHNVRPLILVVDAIGTILATTGSPVETLGYTSADMIGRNALDFVAPNHHEQMMFVFAGPGDHVFKDRHAPFTLELLDADGSLMVVDCAAQRVHKDGESFWVTTLSPHAFQPAPFHAVQAFAQGASANDVALTIAQRLSWRWDDAARIRSFVLSDVHQGRFTRVEEPPPLTSTLDAESPTLLRALTAFVDADAPWQNGIETPVDVVPVERLPAPVADAALAAGFAVASIAIASKDGHPQICLLSFGTQDQAFQGNENVIISQSIATLEMTIRREHSEEILRRHAEEDALTGLANRRAFDAAIEDRSRSTSALLYLDLDRFKAINDNYGHAVGDQVLIEVGHRIKTLCRPDDVVARLGGDEFAILLADVDEAAAARIGRRMLDAIGRPLPPHLGPERVEASAGLALNTAGRLDDDLLTVADLAMLDGKRSGTARLVIA